MYFQQNLSFIKKTISFKTTIFFLKKKQRIKQTHKQTNKQTNKGLIGGGEKERERLCCVAWCCAMFTKGLERFTKHLGKVK